MGAKIFLLVAAFESFISVSCFYYFCKIYSPHNLDLLFVLTV